MTSRPVQTWPIVGRFLSAANYTYFAVLGVCQTDDYVAYLVLLLKRMTMWYIIVCINCVFLRGKAPVVVIMLLCDVSHRVRNLASVLTWRFFRTRFILQFFPIRLFLGFGYTSGTFRQFNG